MRSFPHYLASHNHYSAPYNHNLTPYNHYMIRKSARSLPSDPRPSTFLSLSPTTAPIEAHSRTIPTAYWYMTSAKSYPRIVLTTMYSWTAWKARHCNSSTAACSSAALTAAHAWMAWTRTCSWTVWAAACSWTAWTQTYSWSALTRTLSRIPLSPTMYLLKRILPNLTCGRIIPCLYRLLFLPLSPCFFPPGSSASI